MIPRQSFDFEEGAGPMALADEELFDFDKSRLADWDEERASSALRQAPDLYRNHLTIAKWIDAWINRMERDSSLEREQAEGFVAALGEVAAHLRQTDFLPFGSLLSGM
jgi:hypothetical protein